MTASIKFDGCYHGHSDGLLAGGGSGVAMLGLPGSAGVSAGAVADTEVVPYNVVPELDERVACVIVEPVAANMNLVPPRPGFLEGLRDACSASGALLIFDEVITGFRLGPAGATGWSGVTPDLWCFGKVIGGGLPVGAFGGRRDVMAELAPGGPVYQAGTLSGNPLATAAGLAVLGEVRPADYEALAARVSRCSPRISSRRWPAVAWPSWHRSWGHWSGSSWRRPLAAPIAAPLDYEGARALAAGDTYAAVLPRHAPPRRRAGAGRLRGDVPWHGPRRGRSGPCRRGSGGGGGRSQPVIGRSFRTSE